jgi:hypothetical protein
MTDACAQAVSPLQEASDGPAEDSELLSDVPMKQLDVEDWTGASPHKSALLATAFDDGKATDAIAVSPLILQPVLAARPARTPPLPSPLARDLAQGERSGQESGKPDAEGKDGGDVLEPLWGMLAALTRGCEAPQEFRTCYSTGESTCTLRSSQPQSQAAAAAAALKKRNVAFGAPSVAAPSPATSQCAIGADGLREWSF